MLNSNQSTRTLLLAPPISDLAPDSNLTLQPRDPLKCSLYLSPRPPSSLSLQLNNCHTVFIHCMNKALFDSKSWVSQSNCPHSFHVMVFPALFQYSICCPFPTMLLPGASRYKRPFGTVSLSSFESIDIIPKSPLRQGLTLIHSSGQRKHLLWAAHLHFLA